MMRYRIHRAKGHVYEQLQPAGLVLGHGVLVAKVDGGQAHRGTVVALGPGWARIEFERTKSSEAFKVGDMVCAVHVGRHGLDATVTESGHGLVHLTITAQTVVS